jgi:hypothetical protein
MKQLKTSRNGSKEAHCSPIRKLRWINAIKNGQIKRKSDRNPRRAEANLAHKLMSPQQMSKLE